MNAVADWACIALGCVVAAVNFRLSFFQQPRVEIIGGRPVERHASGIPVVGTVLLTGGGWLCGWSRPAVWAVVAGLAADTAGLPWVPVAFVWEGCRAVLRRLRSSEPEGPTP